MYANSFKNKVAIITGAGQGIGFEIGKQLALQGAKIILNDIDRHMAETAAESINQLSSDSCLPMAGDASNAAFIQQMVDTAVGKYEKLDITIANAGITLFGDFFTYPADDLMRVLQVNLFGTFLLAQAAANQMKKQADGGSLLFTSSVTGHQAHKNLAAYSMTKAAIEMLAKNLVIELSEYKINSNAIAPGATITERTSQDKAYEKTWCHITPMGRPATCQDIAHAALFLVSEHARHITGQSIVIDGGWTSVSPSPF